MRNRKSFMEKSEVGLIDVFIGSAYDVVKLVADNIDVIQALAPIINDPNFNIASEEWVAAYVDSELVGLYSHQGGYDASTNVPDLLSPVPGDVLTGYTYQVTVAGTFDGVDLEVGDVMTANVDDPSSAGDWTIVNRNIDSTAFATADQGLLADSALQPGANVSELVNDAGYVTEDTNTQLTPAEVQAAYDGQVPFATQAEMENGITSAQRRVSPERVKQAIEALAPEADPTTAYVNQRTITASTTLQLTDAGGIIDCDVPDIADVVITVPTDAAVAFPVGTRVDINHNLASAGAGNVGILADSGVTVTGLGAPDFYSIGPGYALSLWKRAANDWVVWGSFAG
jgi:hypothetical protein